MGSEFQFPITQPINIHMKTLANFCFIWLLAGSLVAQINPALEADLQNSLNNSFTIYGIEGVEAAVILPNGCSWNSTAGLQSPGEPIDINEYWSFGSCTKSMTAAITLQLYEEGVLDIHKPIGQYINCDTILYVDSTILIKELLNHTSALGEIWSDGSTLWSAVWSNRDSVWNISSVFEDIYMMPSTSITTHNYTNTNFMLLGMIIQAATGNTLEQEFQNRLFTPLGLAQSSLGTNGVNTSLLNGVYNGNGNNGSLSHNSYYSTRGGSAALISDPMDYASFLRAFHNNDLVSSILMDSVRMITPGGPSAAINGTCLGNYEDHYGYGTHIGLFINPSTNDTLKLFGHGGNGLGVTIGFHNIEHNITFVLAGNDYTATNETGALYIEMLCKIMNYASTACIAGITENNIQKDKELIKIVDALGRETDVQSNTILFYIYSDGSISKVYNVE